MLMIGPETILQGRYRVVRPLGRGGMGAVYEATDLRLSRAVALKETLGETDELRRAFERESRLLANLRHAALPKVLDHFSEGDGLFLVMEFIPGEDLGAMLERSGRPFEVGEVLGWAWQLLDALEYLHTLDPPVLHRDVKPSNIKLVGRGHVVLLDFGLAKGTAGQMTRTGSNSLLAYSPNYSPLEQVRGAGTDERSDLYSLGATLYHLLTGQKPPDAVTRAAALVNGQTDPLLPAHHVNADVPAHVSAALMRALALNMEHRPRDASEMRRDLHEATPRASATVAAGARADATRAVTQPVWEEARPTNRRVVVDVAEQTRVAPAGRRRGGRRWLVALLSLAVMAVFGAGVLLFTQREANQRAAKTPPSPRPAATPRAATPSPTPTPVQQPSATPAPGPAELEARARLSERNLPYSEEAFGRVVEEGDTGAVDLFLAAGMSPDAKDASGRTALIRAAARGSNNISQKLLSRGADPDARDAVGATALMEAAARDHRETVGALLRGGADVNLRDAEGRTALLRAAAAGHSNVVRMLLERGARADLRDRQGRDALAVAERNGRSDVVDLLRRDGQ